MLEVINTLGSQPERKHMALEQQTEMADSDIDALLARHETGVIALANANEPYAIPISYGYDSDKNRFYVRLVSTPESDKRRFLSSSPQARIVVQEDDHPVYRSVIASGELQEIELDQLSAERIQRFGNTKRPLFEIWGESKPDLTVQLYELEPSVLSGRRIRINDAS